MRHFMERVGRLFGVDLDPHHRDGKNLLLLLGAVGIIFGLLVVFVSPLKAVAAVVTFIVIAATFARPDLTVLFLAAYTPFEPFLLKFVPDDVYIYARYFSEGLIYLLVAVVALRLYNRRQRFIGTPLDVPFVFLLLVAAASLVINVVPPFIGILGLRQIVRFILLFFVLIQLEPDKPFIGRITKIMLGVVMFQGVLGAIQAVVGAPLDEFLIPSERKFFESIQLTSGTDQIWSPGSRVFATLGRYDQLGTFLCFFFLLAIGLLYVIKEKSVRRYLWATLIIAAPAFIMTLSRASWFGLALGVVLIGAILMKDWRVRFGIVAIAVAAMAYVAYTGLVVRYLVDVPEQTPLERFFEAFSYERWRGEYYGLGRVYWMVQTPLVVVPNAPLFGWGPGQFGGGAAAALGNARVYDKLNLPFGVYGTDGYIDNNWFSLWGELGTLGIALYLAMWIALARMAFKVWRTAHDPTTKGLALGYIGCLVAVAFQAFLGTYLEVRTLALYFWMYGAFLYTLGRHERVIESS